MMSRPSARLPLVFACIIFLSGVATSVYLGRMRQSALEREVEAGFIQRAGLLSENIRQEFRLFVDVLESIRSLHSISEQIEPPQFNEFLEKGMQYQLRVLQGFGFAQRLGHRERMLRENAGKVREDARLNILAIGEGNKLEPSPAKQIYFPLTYQEPANVLGAPPGYDFGSREVDHEAIQNFREKAQVITGGPCLGFVTNSVSGRLDSEGYYVFAPILYNRLPGTPLPAKEPGYLVGFAVAVLYPEVILERARQRVNDAGLILSLWRGNQTLTMDYGGQMIRTGELVENGKDNLVFTDTIESAGADWIFECRPAPGFGLGADNTQPFLILALGLTLTLFISGEIFFMAVRTRRIERKISERTYELSKAKQELESGIAERERLEKEILEVGNREKLRIGRDLHDSLGQKLTAAVLRGRALVSGIQGNDPESAGEANEVVGLIKSSLSQVRRLAKGLAPVEMGDEGLRGALKRLTRDTHDIHGVDCELECDFEGIELPKSVAVHLYHIAQEAVTNSLRHSGATRVNVSVKSSQAGLVLCIIDNGKGFVPADTAGLGVRIMRHRADMIGGQLEIREADGGGTEVECVLACNGGAMERFCRRSVSNAG